MYQLLQIQNFLQCDLLSIVYWMENISFMISSLHVSSIMIFGALSRSARARSVSLNKQFDHILGRGPKVDRHHIVALLALALNQKTLGAFTLLIGGDNADDDGRWCWWWSMIMINGDWWRWWWRLMMIIDDAHDHDSWWLTNNKATTNEVENLRNFRWKFAKVTINSFFMRIFASE